MYIPAPFRVDDRQTILAFMQQFDFAAVVTGSASGLIASHAPVVVRDVGDDLTIVGHLARANEHWKAMDGETESMVIFSGPHAYISPSWYVSTGMVPTWNYTVVHAYGRPTTNATAAFLRGVVEELTRRQEAHRERPWTTERLAGESYDRMLGAIVGFEMRVDRCEPKFKLGQNRPEADRTGAAAGLDREQSAASAAVDEFMRRYGGAGR
ncbi:MAG TPA: FMN-binding negative transcriptional regulator [Vicinamibacterales bacterium]|nr:FMN-binding negative transcriptional regulator [Vicinamibacterales bacterium]